MLALVTRRTAVAVVRIGTSRDARGAELIGRRVQRTPAFSTRLLGLPMGMGSVAVVTGSAELALVTGRVVKAGTAATAMQIASGRVTAAIAGQTFEMPADLIDSDVTESALLAREAGVASGADALLHSVGPLTTQRRVGAVMQLDLVQSSFDLVRVELGPHHETVDVVQDGEELVLGDVIAAVLGPPLTRDVADAVRQVVPVAFDQLHPHCRVGLAGVSAVAVGDFHAAAFEDDVGAAGGAAAGVAAGVDPRHVDGQPLRVAGEFLAEVVVWCQPVVAGEVGHVVVGDEQLIVLRVGRHHTAAQKVRHQPALHRLNLSSFTC